MQSKSCNITPNYHLPVIVSDYLDPLFKPSTLKGLVKKIQKKLSKVDFDTIAFRGMSGAMFAPIIAHQMNKNLILLRKKNDSSHSCRKIEGNYNLKRYVIIDDEISTGNTVNTIIESITEEFPQSTCVAICLYNQCKIDSVDCLEDGYPNHVHLIV